MKPSKPFLFVLAIVTVAGFTIVETPRARTAHAQDTMPLSTKLTPAMIDYFALDVAFQRPSIATLVACEALPACGASDSSQVRFVDASGQTVAEYDGTPTTTIEQVRRQQTAALDGSVEQRTLVRRFIKDAQGRIVMQGTDSIVKITRANAGTDVSTLTRVHRYSDVRYLLNDPTLLWPITGLVTLELSNVIGPAPRAPAALAGHGAVSFDGTQYAHILTSGALTHRVNLQARLLETTMPAR
jgi:hypothetical protein